MKCRLPENRTSRMRDIHNGVPGRCGGGRVGHLGAHEHRLLPELASKLEPRHRRRPTVYRHLELRRLPRHVRTSQTTTESAEQVQAPWQRGPAQPDRNARTRSLGACLGRSMRHRGPGPAVAFDSGGTRATWTPRQTDGPSRVVRTQSRCFFVRLTETASFQSTYPGAQARSRSPRTPVPESTQPRAT